MAELSHQSNAERHGFMDPIHGTPCWLVLPPDGSVWGEPKIGVEHPGCDHLADLAIELDCFYCQACGWNGRISGAWAFDLMKAQHG